MKTIVTRSLLLLLVLILCLPLAACGKEPLTGISFEGASFVYDGTEKSIEIKGTLPEGVSVSYEGNAQSAVGSYTVIARFTDSTGKYKLPDELRANLTITLPERTVPATGIWANATYRKDTALGTGAKTLFIDVKAEGEYVTFAIQTDAENVGAALLGVGLVSGDTTQYGLFIKVVNGMTADYNVDQTYWGFFKNGEYMTTGVDSTPFESGAHFELIKTK